MPSRSRCSVNVIDVYWLRTCAVPINVVGSVKVTAARCGLDVIAQHRRDQSQSHLQHLGEGLAAGVDAVQRRRPEVEGDAVRGQFGAHPLEPLEGLCRSHATPDSGRSSSSRVSFASCSAAICAA